MQHIFLKLKLMFKVYAFSFEFMGTQNVPVIMIC